MNSFNEGWWNCFLSYTDVISFSMSACDAYDFAKDQMNDAGVTIDELNAIMNDDFIMTDRTRDILIEYNNFLKNEQ